MFMVKETILFLNNDFRSLLPQDYQFGKSVNILPHNPNF